MEGTPARPSLNLMPPDPEQPTLRLAGLARPGDVTRRDRLGGLIHEYSRRHETRFVHPTGRDNREHEVSVGEHVPQCDRRRRDIPSQRTNVSCLTVVCELTRAR